VAMQWDSLIRRGKPYWGEMTRVYSDADLSLLVRVFLGQAEEVPLHCHMLLNVHADVQGGDHDCRLSELFIIIYLETAPEQI
jgi:hypothetical protein